MTKLSIGSYLSSLYRGADTAVNNAAAEAAARQDCYTWVDGSLLTACCIGPDGEPAWTRIVQLGTPSGTATTTVIVLTGVRGLDGPLGTSCLLHMLQKSDQWATLASEHRIQVLLVHAANPWGCSWACNADVNGRDPASDCVAERPTNRLWAEHADTLLQPDKPLSDYEWEQVKALRGRDRSAFDRDFFGPQAEVRDGPGFVECRDDRHYPSQVHDLLGWLARRYCNGSQRVAVLNLTTTHLRRQRVLQAQHTAGTEWTNVMQSMLAACDVQATTLLPTGTQNSALHQLQQAAPKARVLTATLAHGAIVDVLTRIESELAAAAMQRLLGPPQAGMSAAAIERHLAQALARAEIKRHVELALRGHALIGERATAAAAETHRVFENLLLALAT